MIKLATANQVRIKQEKIKKDTYKTVLAQELTYIAEQISNSLNSENKSIVYILESNLINLYPNIQIDIVKVLAKLNYKITTKSIKSKVKNSILISISWRI